MSNPITEAALSLIQAMTEAQPKFDAINKASSEVFGDFNPHVTPVAECVYGPLITLLDAALGDDEMASYFLHECWHGGGAVHEATGKVWPIATVDDLRAYINRPRDENG